MVNQFTKSKTNHWMLSVISTVLPQIRSKTSWKLFTEKTPDFGPEDLWQQKWSFTRPPMFSVWFLTFTLPWSGNNYVLLQRNKKNPSNCMMMWFGGKFFLVQLTKLSKNCQIAWWCSLTENSLYSRLSKIVRLHVLHDEWWCDFTENSTFWAFIRHAT